MDVAGISSQSIDLVANHLHSGELQRVLSPWITGTNTLYAALSSRKFIPKRASVLPEFMTSYTRTVIKKMEERSKYPGGFQTKRSGGNIDGHLYCLGAMK